MRTRSRNSAAADSVNVIAAMLRSSVRPDPTSAIRRSISVSEMRWWPPAASNFPSGLKATAPVVPARAGSFLTNSPEDASQRATVSSSTPEAIHFPSGDHDSITRPP